MERTAQIGLRGHRVREPRAADARRHSVLAAAAKVFAEKGYWETSVDDIATQLDLTKGTIYYYFSSKSELYLEIQLSAVKQAIGSVENIVRHGEGPTTTLRKIVAAQVRETLSGLNQYAVLLHDPYVLSGDAFQTLRNAQREYERLITEVIESGMQSGEFRPGIPKLTAFTILRATMGVAKWYRPSGAWSPDQVVESMTDQLLGGVVQRPPAG